MQVAQSCPGEQKALTESARAVHFSGFARGRPALALLGVALLVLGICQYLRSLPETETVVSWQTQEVTLGGGGVQPYLSAERHGAFVALMLQAYGGPPDSREQHRNALAQAIRPQFGRGSRSPLTVLYPDEAMAGFVAPHPAIAVAGK